MQGPHRSQRSSGVQHLPWNGGNDKKKKNSSGINKKIEAFASLVWKNSREAVAFFF